MTRLIRSALVCLLVGLAAGMAYAQGTVKLEFKYTPGEVLRYKTVMDMSVSLPNGGQAGVPVKVVLVENQQVKSVAENGDAEIECKVESMKLSVFGTAQSFPIPQVTTVKTVGRNGALKGMRTIGQKGPDPLSAMPVSDMQAMASVQCFPATDFKAGDTWTYDVPVSGTIVKAQGRLVSTDTTISTGKVAVFKVEAAGSANAPAQTTPAPVGENPPADGKDQPAPAQPATETKPAPPAAGVPGVGVKAVHFNMTGYFSPEKGKLVKMDGKGNVAMALSLPSSQSNEPATITAEFAYQMYLLPPEKAK